MSRIPQVRLILPRQVRHTGLSRERVRRRASTSDVGRRWGLYAINPCQRASSPPLCPAPGWTPLGRSWKEESRCIHRRCWLRLCTWLHWETHRAIGSSRTYVRYTGGRHVVAYAASICPRRALQPQVASPGRATLGIKRLVLFARNSGSSPHRKHFDPSLFLLRSFRFTGSLSFVIAMFFTKAVTTFAFAVSALALSIPRADNVGDALNERASPPWLSGTQSGSGEPALLNDIPPANSDCRNLVPTRLGCLWVREQRIGPHCRGLH